MESYGELIKSLRFKLQAADHGLEEQEREIESLRRENAVLAQWKKETLSVESWWLEVDAFVRKMPECERGKHVAKEAMRLLEGAVELREALEALYDVHQSCGIHEVPYGYRSTMDRVKAILNSK